MVLKKLEQQKLDMIQSLMRLFKEQYKGRQNAVKTDKILFHLTATGQGTLSPQTFRELLGYIRKQDMMAPGFIVATVNLGYWYTTDKKEIDSYINQELDRMSNQFGNIQSVHQRTRSNSRNSKDSNSSLQSELF